MDFLPIGRRLSDHCCDEFEYLWLLDLDGSGVVLIEGGVNLIEGCLGELVSRAEVYKNVLDELFGLILIDGTALVHIISVPLLVHEASDDFFLGDHRLSFL